MFDKDYIFNVPKNHIFALLTSVYTTESEVYKLTVQEIGEFLQALSKRDVLPTLEEEKKQREHLIEEMTHVLVCLGMLAISNGVLQSEIDNQIKKKAIAGVDYPFSINEHAPVDQVIKDLKNCSFGRTSGKFDPTYNRMSCKTGEFSDATVTCRALLDDALYHLQQAYGKTEGSDLK